MNTRHDDKKRKVTWGISKATSTEKVSVLAERNAEQPMGEQLLLPPAVMTNCSDSHLCAQKEASDVCAPSIESIDIDQGRIELHLNETEVVVVEIRPIGRKMPPLSDLKRRRRKLNQNEMRVLSGFLATRTNAFINDMTIQN